MDEELASIKPSPWIRRLNAVAVTLSCAVVVGAGFSAAFRHWDFALPCMISTLFFTSLWQRSLRRRGADPKLQTKRGWWWSLPYSAFNTLGAALLLAIRNRGADGLADVLPLVLVVFSFGTLLWVPACVVVVLVYGITIARIARVSPHGAPAADRMEVRLSAINSVISIFALTFASFIAHRPGGGLGGIEHAAQIATYLAAGGALGLSMGAMLLVSQRDRKRRGFLAKIESGESPQYRIDVRKEEVVLLRVDTADAYRGHVAQEVAVLERSPDFRGPALGDGNKTRR